MTLYPIERIVFSSSFFTRDSFLTKVIEREKKRHQNMFALQYECECVVCIVLQTSSHISKGCEGLIKSPLFWVDVKNNHSSFLYLNPCRDRTERKSDLRKFLLASSIKTRKMQPQKLPVISTLLLEELKQQDFFVKNALLTKGG